jgi:glutamyl-tRNA synthetase
MLKPRAQFVSDIVEQGAYFFQFDGEYEAKAEAKQFNSENAELLEELAKRYEQSPGFSEATAETVLAALAEEREIKKAKIIHPTRLAVSGTSRGPGLFEMLAALGQPVVVERLRMAVAHIRDAE